MTRAPRSASWRVQNGAAIACSSVTTVTPSSGRTMASERARQAEHVLGNIRQDQVRRDRRHLVEAGLAELAFDVVFAGETETAVCLQADVRRFPRCLGGEQLCHVRLGAAALLRVVEFARAE